MSQFVLQGGNFFTQCGSINSYEQCSPNRNKQASLSDCPTGFWMTNSGLELDPGNNGFSTEVDFAPDTAFGQFTLDWVYQKGTVTSMSLWNTVTDKFATSNSTLNAANGAHWVVGTPESDRLDGYLYFAAH